MALLFFRTIQFEVSMWKMAALSYLKDKIKHLFELNCCLMMLKKCTNLYMLI